MKIEANTGFIVVRISQYGKINSFQEHLTICSQEGGVWFLKLGRKIPGKSLNKIINNGQIVLLKEPKKTCERYMVAKLLKYHLGYPTEDMVYPKYYDAVFEENSVVSSDRTWLYFTELKLFPIEKVENILIQKSKKKMTDIINITRTTVLYVESQVSLSI